MDLKQAIQQSLTKHRQGINDATLYWAVRIEHAIDAPKEAFESQLSRLLLEGKVQRRLNNRLYLTQTTELTKPTKLQAWERKY